MLLGGIAHAQTDAVHCRSIEGGNLALENIDAGVRLHFLRTELARGARNARIWSYTWVSLYSALTVAQGIAALTLTNESDKIDYGIGAGASFIGVFVIVVAPLNIIGDQRRLEKRLRLAPPDEDPCAQLADAERALLRGAKSEAFGKSALVHGGSFVFNAALGIALGVGFGHWNAAMQVALIGIVVGEIQIGTQPTDVVHTLRNYRQGRLATNTPNRFSWGVAPDVSRQSVGARFALTW